MSIFAPVASGGSLTVYGGPTYDATTGTGYQIPILPLGPGSNIGNGAAICYARKFSAGTNLGERAIRWGTSGSVELRHLGTDSRGFTNCFAHATNGAGNAAGSARKYSDGADLGTRAVRWDASGTATELGNLGTNSSGFTNNFAYAINSAGTAAGAAKKYSGETNLGYRAVRWDASGTATELDNLGTNSTGATDCYAYAINGAGTAVGAVAKYSTSSLGHRAVRWDAAGTAATELGHIGATSDGSTYCRPEAINSAGTAVGYAYKFSGNAWLGYGAVRWDASATAATELGNLGTNISVLTFDRAWAINSAGDAVGSVDTWSDGTWLGNRAVRWNASGAAATELGNLGTSISGQTNSSAYGINSAGFAVGSAQKYNGGTLLGYRAVLWDLDDVAIDLNTLIDATIGWTLIQALGISDTNWVSGVGLFDPDGAGPLAAYDRAFLLDVSSVVATQCPADIAPALGSGDGVVNILDVLAVISAYGAMVPPANPADINGDNVVNILDILAVISAWGPCPI